MWMLGSNLGALTAEPSLQPGTLLSYLYLNNWLLLQHLVLIGHCFLNCHRFVSSRLAI